MNPNSIVRGLGALSDPGGDTFNASSIFSFLSGQDVWPPNHAAIMDNGDTLKTSWIINKVRGGAGLQFVQLTMDPNSELPKLIAHKYAAGPAELAADPVKTAYASGAWAHTYNPDGSVKLNSIPRIDLVLFETPTLNIIVGGGFWLENVNLYTAGGAAEGMPHFGSVFLCGALSRVAENVTGTAVFVNTFNQIVSNDDNNNNNNNNNNNDNDNGPSRNQHISCSQVSYEPPKNR